MIYLLFKNIRYSIGDTVIINATCGSCIVELKGRIVGLNVYGGSDWILEIITPKVNGEEPVYISVKDIKTIEKTK